MNGLVRLQLLRYVSGRSCIRKPSTTLFEYRHFYSGPHAHFSNVTTKLPSATGFNDYLAEKKDFKLEAPKDFNFATHVIDKWANEQKVNFYGTLLYGAGRFLPWRVTTAGFYPMGRNTFFHQAMGENREKRNCVITHEKTRG